MPKIKLTKTTEELMEMRRNGMTNRDIANVLGVSYETILRYIGSQPNKKGTKYADYCVQKAYPEKAQPAAEDDGARLPVTNRLIELKGNAVKYAVCYGEKEVVLEACGDDCSVGGNISFAELPGFIRELQTIARKTQDCRLGVEIW